MARLLCCDVAAMLRCGCCVVAWLLCLAWLLCCGRKRAIFVPTPSDFSLVIEKSRSSGKNEAILGVRCVNYAATPKKISEKPKFALINWK